MGGQCGQVGGLTPDGPEERGALSWRQWGAMLRILDLLVETIEVIEKF